MASSVVAGTTTTTTATVPTEQFANKRKSSFCMVISIVVIQWLVCNYNKLERKKRKVRVSTKFIKKRKGKGKLQGKTCVV